jgi:hypothetical protein
VLSNFDENSQFLHISWLFSIGIFPEDNLVDLISGNKVVIENNLLELSPYQHLWVIAS